jgi:hypothetical protein
MPLKIFSLWLGTMVLILGHTWAQNPVASKTFFSWDEENQRFMPDREARWFYDQAGKEKASALWVWQEKSRSWKLAQETQSQYDSVGREFWRWQRDYERGGEAFAEELTEWTFWPNGEFATWSLKKWDLEQDRWENHYREAQTFDDHGCKLALETFRGGGQVWIPQRRTHFTYEADCRLATRVEANYQAGQWRNDQRESYSYPDSMVQIQYEVWDDSLGAWTGQRTTHQQLDEENRLLHAITTYADSSQYWIGYRYTAKGQVSYHIQATRSSAAENWYFWIETGSSYNAQGQQLTDTLRTEYDSTRQIFRNIVSRDFIYQSDGLPLKEEVLQELTDSSGFVNQNRVRFDFEHQYYCDGLLQSSRTHRTKDAQSQPLNLLEYGYRDGVECLTVLSPLKVYPNPTRESLSIQSELLLEAGSSLRIFDLSGRQVWQEEIEIRAPVYRLQLPPLSPAIYLLEVCSGTNCQTARWQLLP